MSAKKKTQPTGTVTTTADKGSFSEITENILTAKETVLADEIDDDPATLGDLRFKLSGRIPGVFGDYSFLEFGIEVEEKNIDVSSPETAYHRLAVRYTPIVVRNVNEILAKLGKPNLKINLMRKGELPNGQEKDSTIAE